MRAAPLSPVVGQSDCARCGRRVTFFAGLGVSSSSAEKFVKVHVEVSERIGAPRGNKIDVLPHSRSLAFFKRSVAFIHLTCMCISVLVFFTCASDPRTLTHAHTPTPVHPHPQTHTRTRAAGEHVRHAMPPVAWPSSSYSLARALSHEP